MADLLTSLTELFLPLTQDCTGQRFTISLNWLKGLGDGLGHTVWWAMELYRNPEEAARTL
jgi:hypothetical protein